MPTIASPSSSRRSNQQPWFGISQISSTSAVWKRVLQRRGVPKRTFAMLCSRVVFLSKMLSSDFSMFLAGVYQAVVLRGVSAGLLGGVLVGVRGGVAMASG